MAADCHIHMLMDGVDWKTAHLRHRDSVDIPWIRNTLETYRRKGFTYLRDGGDRWGVGAAARELSGEYGITYRTPIAPLYKRGHYGSFLGRGFETMAYYAALVYEMKEQGCDFIKIMISGLMDFNQFGKLTEAPLSPAEIREMIEIAHDEGLAVMAHANGARAMEAAAAAGVDSIEHGAYADEEALAAMKENGTIWVPTLSTIGNLRGKGRFSEKDVVQILESAQENVSRFAAMGGLIAAGSDAGAWAVPHGTLSEYELLTEILGSEAEPILQAGLAAVQKKF